MDIANVTDICALRQPYSKRWIIMTKNQQRYFEKHTYLKKKQFNF